MINNRIKNKVKNLKPTKIHLSFFECLVLKPYMNIERIREIIPEKIIKITVSEFMD
jgi:hypothetical protein